MYTALTQDLHSTALNRSTMAPMTKILVGAVSLLMVDSIIEMAFISNMVSWLHRRAGGDFFIDYPKGSVFPLHGKPEGLLVNQGHTSNGAAGTAFVAIGMGGLLILWLRHRQLQRSSTESGVSKFLHRFWVIMTVLSALLAFAALVYTFVVTYQHDHQSIDVAVASGLPNHPYPDYVAYPALQWTPENWFTAVLKLNLNSPGDRSDIQSQLRLMKAWRWNLIPLWIIGTAVAALAVVDMVAHRRGASSGRGQRLNNYSRKELESADS